MYLDPHGWVRACCQNQYHPLGNVRQQSLLEIWNGDAVRELRERVGRADYSLGCELCAVRIDMGAADSAFLHTFDGLEVSEPEPRWPRQLELALSNACNLQCLMCNGELSSAIRIHRERRPPIPTVYDDRFFEELDLFLPHLERVVFHGGEPFLGREPLRVMHRLVEMELRPACHVTTNGTQWSERIDAFLRSVPTHVVISVDGTTAQTVEAVRIGVDHAELLRNVTRLQESAEAGGGGSSLAFCLMRSTWQELGDVLLWADELDVDLIVNTVAYPPHLSLSHLPRSRVAEVLEALRAREPAIAGRLGRNRAVWYRVLQDIEVLARGSVADGADVGGSPAVSVELTTRRAEPAADGRPGDSETPPFDTVLVGSSQLIEEVRPGSDESAGIDPAVWVGRPPWELVYAFRRELGPMRSTRLERMDDGTEKRTMIFADGVRRTRVTVVMVESDRGQRLLVSRAAEDAV